MKDWWQWLLVGLVVGAVSTWFGAQTALTHEERVWLDGRDTTLARLAADSGALVAAVVARQQADSSRRAAESRAARAEGEDRLLAKQAAVTRAQLATATTARDSLDLTLILISQQTVQLAKKDAANASLHEALAAASARATADSVALGIVTGERNALKVLVETAPVGKKSPKLFGVLPMPEVIVGYGVTVNGDGARTGVQVTAGYRVLGR